MIQEIRKNLEQVEAANNIRILYACESGSRAWGFESPDSDYDVRFVYVQPLDNYLSIRDRKDVIEVPVNENLDISGWDIRKALQLFLKSNAPLYEWLQFQLSTIPKGIKPMAVMNFNKDGYSVYCKEYNEYWQWVASRNDARYQNTLAHGKNYDSKNMMHTFRLLNMAEEIALFKKVIVHREDRDFLLQIRKGEFDYEDLMLMVEEKIKNIEQLYKMSDLPETPDVSKAENLLIDIRRGFYRDCN